MFHPCMMLNTSFTNEIYYSGGLSVFNKPRQNLTPYCIVLGGILLLVHHSNARVTIVRFLQEQFNVRSCYSKRQSKSRNREWNTVFVVVKPQKIDLLAIVWMALFNSRTPFSSPV